MLEEEAAAVPCDGLTRNERTNERAKKRRKTSSLHSEERRKREKTRSEDRTAELKEASRFLLLTPRTKERTLLLTLPFKRTDAYAIYHYILLLLTDSIFCGAEKASAANDVQRTNQATTTNQTILPTIAEHVRNSW